MNMDQMDLLLRQKASSETASWGTSTQLDKRIQQDARSHKTGKRKNSRTDLFRRVWIPVSLSALACLYLLFYIFPGQTRSTVMEKDCLQFYTQLTKAINEKNIEKITASYDNRSAGMEENEMRSRLEHLFTEYDSISYKPGDISVKAEGTHAIIMSAFELTAVSRNGNDTVSATGTERLYLQRNGNEIKVALWVLE